YGLEQRVDFSGLSLQVVITGGWYLSSAWRRHFEELLGACVLDSFGFSEIAEANAVECLDCGWYHAGPAAIVEVLDPDSDAPVDSGPGLLAVTSLFPWVRDLVLLRYAPGDVVEIGPECPARGERGFRYLGRST